MRPPNRDVCLRLIYVILILIVLGAAVEQAGARRRPNTELKVVLKDGAKFLSLSPIWFVARYSMKAAVTLGGVFWLVMLGLAIASGYDRARRWFYSLLVYLVGMNLFGLLVWFISAWIYETGI